MVRRQNFTPSNDLLIAQILRLTADTSFGHWDASYVNSRDVRRRSVAGHEGPKTPATEEPSDDESWICAKCGHFGLGRNYRLRHQELCAQSDRAAGRPYQSAGRKDGD